MALRDFLLALFEHGHVRVPPVSGEPEPAEDGLVDAVLSECEVVRRMDFPGEAPEFLLPPARWAAEQFYRACQLCVFRDAGPEMIEAALSGSCPAAPSAAQHYSVDIVFRFLPDLIRQATTAAPEDPLVAYLRRWAVDWPLSSIGISDLENAADLGPIVAHPDLLRFYVDRVLARGDVRRLSEPMVRRAVQAALGERPQLAPAFAAALAVEPSV